MQSPARISPTLAATLAVCLPYGIYLPQIRVRQDDPSAKRYIISFTCSEPFEARPPNPPSARPGCLPASCLLFCLPVTSRVFFSTSLDWPSRVACGHRSCVYFLPFWGRESCVAYPGTQRHMRFPGSAGQRHAAREVRGGGAVVHAPPDPQDGALITSPPPPPLLNSPVHSYARAAPDRPPVPPRPLRTQIGGMLTVVRGVRDDAFISDALASKTAVQVPIVRCRSHPHPLPINTLPTSSPPFRPSEHDHGAGAHALRLTVLFALSHHRRRSSACTWPSASSTPTTSASPSPMSRWCVSLSAYPCS